MIKLNNINKSYQDQIIFSDLSLDISLDSTLCIYGPSGVGKTTLCNMIANLDHDYSGNIDIHFKNPQINISIMPQASSLIHYFNVYENLVAFTDANNEEIDTILKAFGIFELKEELISDISGGQKQRVNLAKSVLANPDLIILDEPTAGLDNSTTDQILDLLDTLKIKMIVVSHDVRVQKRYSNNILELEQNEIKYFYNKIVASDSEAVDVKLCELNNDNLYSISVKKNRKHLSRITAFISLILAATILAIIVFMSQTIHFNQVVTNLFGENSGRINAYAQNLEPDKTIDIMGYEWNAIGNTIIPGYHYFTQEELDYISNYEGLENFVVEYVTLPNSYYTYKNGEVAKPITYNNVNYQLLTLPANIDIMSDYGTLLNDGFSSDFIYGNPSSLNYDELIVPLAFANEQALENKSKIEDIIGSELDVQLESGDIVTYTIVGIVADNVRDYDSNDSYTSDFLYAGPLEIPSQNIAYYSFNDYALLNGIGSLDQSTVKANYDNATINEDDINYELISALQNDYASLENLNAAFQTGVSSVSYHLKDGYTYEDFEQYLYEGPDPLKSRYNENPSVLAANKAYNETYAYKKYAFIMVIVVTIIIYFIISLLFKIILPEFRLAIISGYSTQHVVKNYTRYILNLFIYGLIFANIIAMMLVIIFTALGFTIYFKIQYIVLVNLVIGILLLVLCIINIFKVTRLNILNAEDVIV